MIPRAFLAGVLFFLWAQASLPSQNTVISDDLGHPWTLESPPQHIVSLAPNITEILFSLGLGDQVAGVTRYCDYPEDALKKKKIGGLVDPNIETIKALNPDLVIGFRGNPLRILNRLRDFGLPLFVLEEGSTLESVFLVIHKVGTVTQKQKEADAILQRMKKKYESIQYALEDVHSKPKVFFLLHGMGLWTFGQGSFLNDLAEKSKGLNIAGTIPRKWLLYNREQLIYEDPEVIVILAKSEKEFEAAKAWFKSDASLQNLQAVKTHRMRFLDENLAQRPGPRIIEALEQLAKILHPQEFE